MKTVTVALLLGWLLMTPRGPIVGLAGPIVFPTYEDCREIADWLNAEVTAQTGQDRGWYWCAKEVI